LIVTILEDFLPMLTKAIQRRELEKALEENGNNDFKIMVKREKRETSLSIFSPTNRKLKTLHVFVYKSFIASSLGIATIVSVVT
jgi:hypothetical protein